MDYLLLTALSLGEAPRVRQSTSFTALTSTSCRAFGSNFGGSPFVNVASVCRKDVCTAPLTLKTKAFLNLSGAPLIIPFGPKF